MYFLLEMRNKRDHKMRTGYLKKMKYAFTSYFIRLFQIYIVVLDYALLKKIEDYHVFYKEFTVT